VKESLAKAKIDESGQEKWEAEAKKNTKGLPKPVIDALKAEAEKRTDAQKKALAQHYRDSVAPETESLRKELTAATAKRDEFNKTIPTTLVSMTAAPRTIRVLPRGNWLDETGEVVQPAIPEFLGTLGKAERATRMDLAKWMVSPDNPLTARVFVNRLWKIAFGQGLVRNMDDFGTQGTPPTHPELLDWLASEFVGTGWDVKGMLKLMVMSNAYRQSSAVAKDVRDRDPANAWLARQNRFRLDAEFVRDAALATAGLLTTKVGGPSSKPYQPAGYWAYLNFPQREWQADKNEDQYRRGLYAYWCRSFLHPSLAAFDAPSREECTNERPRSSTPIQALVLLNDPTYVEAARVLAAAILKDGSSTADRINAAYRRTLSRTAKPEEMKILEALLQKHLDEFKEDPDGAKKLLAVGIAPLPSGMDLGCPCDPELPRGSDPELRVVCSPSRLTANCELPLRHGPDYDPPAAAPVRSFPAGTLSGRQCPPAEDGRGHLVAPRRRAVCRSKPGRADRRPLFAHRPGGTRSVGRVQLVARSRTVRGV
jgi:Protein of unknown function (DUF1553)